ncbi:MAG: MFS transporter, partial [Thermomicrobium sp.]|nr:MFS transporter [Thermomicrobium sp.]
GPHQGPYIRYAFPIVFPVLQGLVHVDRATLSLIITADVATFGLCQFLSGVRSDFTAWRTVLLAGFASCGLAASLCPAAHDRSVLLLGCMRLGVTNAFTTPILRATLGDVLPSLRLRRTIARLSAANPSGHLLGSLVTGLLVAWSWRLFLGSVALLSWGIRLWLAVWFRRSGHAVPPRPRVRSLRQA